MSNTFDSDADIDQLVSLIADRYPHWEATPAGLQRLASRLDPGRHRPVNSRPELLTRLGLIEYLRKSADAYQPTPTPDVIDAGDENLSVDDPDQRRYQYLHRRYRHFNDELLATDAALDQLGQSMASHVRDHASSPDRTDIGATPSRPSMAAEPVETWRDQLRRLDALADARVQASRDRDLYDDAIAVFTGRDPAADLDNVAVGSGRGPCFADPACDQPADLPAPDSDHYNACRRHWIASYLPSAATGVGPDITAASQPQPDREGEDFLRRGRARPTRSAQPSQPVDPTGGEEPTPTDLAGGRGPHTGSSSDSPGGTGARNAADQAARRTFPWEAQGDTVPEAGASPPPSLYSPADPHPNPLPGVVRQQHDDLGPHNRQPAAQGRSFHVRY